MITTKPKAAGHYPAVLLIGGLGCLSRGQMTGKPENYVLLKVD